MLQVRLADHPALISFPETHLLEKATHGRSGMREQAGLISRSGMVHGREFIRALCDEWGVASTPVLRLLKGVRLATYVKRFFLCLDELARHSEEAQGWIEKTPSHVRHIETIEQTVRAPKFIHIIREGLPVVGSLYDVTRRYPQNWDGVWSLDKCIQTWNKDVSCSLACSHKENHLLISYEAFIDAPRHYLQAIWHFLGLSGIEVDPDASTDDQFKVVEDFEEWKAQASGPIRKVRNRRAEDTFMNEDIRSIRENLRFGGKVPGKYFSSLEG